MKQQCDSGQDALVVRVHTDEGTIGIGEVDSAPLAAQAAIVEPYSHTITSGLKHIIVGEGPVETEYIWDKMYKHNIYAGRFGAGLHAMNGIDISLWDITGKKLGMPVWKLLGGGFRKSIRCYSSSLFGPTPEATGEIARRFVGEGFTSVKFGWANGNRCGNRSPTRRRGSARDSAIDSLASEFAPVMANLAFRRSLVWVLSWTKTI